MSKASWLPKYCPAWFVQAAEVMVRLQCNLKAAALEVGHPLDPDEADKISRRRDFKEILDNERNKYYASVANDPTRTKSAILGRMMILADKLISDGEHDKAASVLEKLSKMEGWSGNEGNINIFSGLTARDIAEARERINKSSKRTPEIEETDSGDGLQPADGLAN
jgi:hypothetical protein